MITNERQYKISRTQATRLQKAVKSLIQERSTSQLRTDILAKAELEAIRSETDVLSEEIRAYEVLRSGSITILKADTIEELPTILIRARIAQQLSQRELAQALDLKEQQIQRYESEEYASASLRRLSQVADALKLNISEVAELKPKIPARAPAKASETNWESFPVKEMYRRGWFRDIDFEGSLTTAMANQISLAMNYAQQAMPRRQPALLRHRARIGSQMDPFSLWAWQCRILFLAKSEPLKNKYFRGAITNDWLRKLVQLSPLEDGPIRAKKMLNEIGISLIIEPHLPKTYLDGAAFLLPAGNPVIGMTLRYDRIDNFWFVLLHELAHVIKHLRKGQLEDIFDDLDAEPDDLEKEADAIAGDALIPEDLWEIALARYVRTEDAVQAFANEQKIHPAIVAGRVRKEADNYMILSDLIGTGKVRAQFSEVRFGQ